MDPQAAFNAVTDNSFTPIAFRFLRDGPVPLIGSGRDRPV